MDKDKASFSNKLYYGDNLDILRRYVEDETVDLIYIDPPFKSNQDYNVLFAEQSGVRSAAQIKAFEDTWRWDQGAALSFQQVVEGGGNIAQAMLAFRQFLGENDMLAYMAMMAPRLLELRRVLKSTGSIYLHCDSAASHYLKVLMDAVFGSSNFQNEIIWQRTSAHNDPSRYGRVHDSLLFYSKTDNHKWNQQYEPPDERYFEAHDFERDEKGLLFRKRDLTAPAHKDTASGQYEWKGRRPPKGRMWSYTKENMERLEAEGRVVYTKTGMPRLKIYADDLKGVPFQDVWATSDLWLNSAASERLGYPTQKPEALLERMIKASSNEGDAVLDPFCGCGTAIAAAHKLNRRWIGIDITHLAITLIKHRLHDSFGKQVKYEVLGEPVDVGGAELLAEQDPYQFQWWALGLVGARPTEQKKGADQGIDGRVYFHDEHLGSGKTKQIIFSVKAGHITPVHVRELRGVAEREQAQIGVLISLEEPTKPMRSEAAKAGFYEPPTGAGGQKYARLQLLTVSDLLSGKEVAYPHVRANVTFKKAPKSKEQVPQQLLLAAEEEATYGESEE